MIDFGLLGPDINSGRMYAGPGPGSMLAAAASWDGLATEMWSAEASYSSAMSRLTSGPRRGPASVSMAAAAAAYVGRMNATAAETASQVRAAASAFEAAFAATVAYQKEIQRNPNELDAWSGAAVPIPPGYDPRCQAPQQITAFFAENYREVNLLGKTRESPLHLARWLTLQLRTEPTDTVPAGWSD